MGVAKNFWAGVTMAAAAVGTLVVTAAMLSWAGLNYATAYTAGTLLSVIGTLLLHRQGIYLVAMPSVTVTAYLVFIIAISNGLGWQQLLGIGAVASALGCGLGLVAAKKKLCLLPPALSWGISLALAVYLIVQGLVLGRIIVTSPWSVTMVGGFYDPLAYWSLAGIIVTMSLIAANCAGALFYGMAFTLAATLLEGFWVIPAAPFFLPGGLDVSLGQLRFMSDTPQQMSLFWLTSLCLPLWLGTINTSSLLAFVPGRKQDAGWQASSLLSAVSVGGALLGTTPLTIAPASAAGRGGTGPGVTAGALTVLLAALFSEPVVAAWADFPAMAVTVLVGSGLVILLRLSRQVPLSPDQTKRRAELMTIAVLVLLLPLTNNFATALGAGLIGYSIFMFCAGKARELSCSLGVLSLLFAGCFAYSMFL